MSEKQTAHPNRPNYTFRRLAVGAGAGTLLLGAYAGGNAIVNHVQDANALRSGVTSPDALSKYKDGEIKKGDVVVIKVKDAGNGNPADVAVRINREGTDTRDLASEITPQVDASGDPGVQDEVLVLDKSEVDPKVAQEWAATPQEIAQGNPDAN